MIPDELTSLHQWVVWSFEQRDGRQTKTPIDPHNGRLAKTNDPTTWASFEEAAAAAERLGCDGIGFVFAATDPYVGIDLDHCRDSQTGEISAQARQIIDELASYAEISVSGTGVHLIVRGSMPAGSRHRGRIDGLEVEIYAQGRYFVMTGQELA